MISFLETIFIFLFLRWGSQPTADLLYILTKWARGRSNLGPGTSERKSKSSPRPYGRLKKMIQMSLKGSLIIDVPFRRLWFYFGRWGDVFLL